MNAKPELPRDEDARDQDKPLNLANAADHRPDTGSAEPDDGANDGAGNQNDSVKEPNPALLQEQQRSQGMNHSGWEGKN